ncbi:hypothetical protein G134_451 [Lactobacillus delbrueckii subsp. lactis CRL581]|nr:hypothetical protein G134_451 [Lactobacillus delbrueckii subsp. lactis CRL581]
MTTFKNYILVMLKNVLNYYWCKQKCDTNGVMARYKWCN